MGHFTQFLSTLATAPTSYFVYSAFSYYGSRRGWALPGLWFVRALGQAGRDEATVRQTLYRMSAEGELTAERAGRSKVYRPTAFARAEIEAGTDKILKAPEGSWDGRWTVVHVRLRGSEQRVTRKRVEELLRVEGFARLGGGAYVHPWPVGDRVYGSLPDDARPYVIVVRGEMVVGSAAELSTLWNVKDLSVRYERVNHQFSRLAERLDTRMCTDREAFLLRFAVVFAYLGVAWDDPELPAALVEPDWPGPEARRRAASLYRRLMPGATRHADGILRSVSAGVARAGV